VVAFKTARKLKSVQEELPNIYACIDNLNEELHRRIDQEISRTDELYRDSIKHTDSRVDKLESKFNNVKELIDDITGLTIKK
jgi:tetrahydromethanopterin S-methyltransferase subunit G